MATTETTLVVHYMRGGQTACMRRGVPAEWSANHKWDSDWEVVTCKKCLRGKIPIDTFRIGDGGRSILCLHCGTTSHSKTDVDNRYCGHCHVYHDDIWPPARHWWITAGREKPFGRIKDMDAVMAYKLGQKHGAMMKRELLKWHHEKQEHGLAGMTGAGRNKPATDDPAGPTHAKSGTAAAVRKQPGAGASGSKAKRKK